MNKKEAKNRIEELRKHIGRLERIAGIFPMRSKNSDSRGRTLH